MDKENLIRKISKGESLTGSKELFAWVNQSKENEAEYIRHKNLWALLQRGKEMDSESIEEGLKSVKQNHKKGNKYYLFNVFIRYAAIIVFALLAGYLINSISFNPEVAMNEIMVPKGNRTSVVLPDGTKVWLNNGTKLIYPESFEKKTREVELVGEGYFEVTHDKKHPFIVKIGKNRVKVLGTKFSITAYPNDETVRTDLISGKVQFDIYAGNGNYKSFLVKPSHSLVYSKTSGKLSETKIPDGFYDYWEKGVYEFKNEKFISLAKKIERIYNVEIIFEDELIKDRLFTGTFNIDDNIYTMMEVFQRASGMPFKYTRERNKIFIKAVN